MTFAPPPSEPAFTLRDGVRLAHFEAGPPAPEGPPLLLVNGWTGDHGIFTPQIAHFGRERRVVAVNLRGHGRSDAPEGGYTVQGFADDIAFQCRAVGLEKPVVVGHSGGGIVALELCGRYPDFAAGLILIDSPIMIAPEPKDLSVMDKLLAGFGGAYTDLAGGVAMMDARPVPPPSDADLAFEKLLAGIGGRDYLAVSRANAWEIGCDHDDPARRQAIFDRYILGPCLGTPQHVAFSALRAMAGHDPTPAVRACRVPMAYISADVPTIASIRTLDRLRALCPQLAFAQTLLAGHFNTIEVADQVNAMIARFLAVGLRPRAGARAT